MKVYIREQSGERLIEVGKEIFVEEMKKPFLITGEKDRLSILGEYESIERARDILNEIIQRIVQPTAREVGKGVIFIDLKGIK